MSTSDIEEEKLKKFKMGLMMRLANTDDLVRLIRVAAALDDEAQKKLKDHIESNHE